MKDIDIGQPLEKLSHTSSGQVNPVSTEEWLTVHLNEHLTINEVEFHQPEFIDALAQADHLLLDPSNLGAVDIAGIQLLVALRTSAVQAGKTLQWATAPKGALRATLITSGLCMVIREGVSNLGGDPFWCED